MTYIATIADNAKAMPTPNIACDATDTTTDKGLSNTYIKRLQKIQKRSSILSKCQDNPSIKQYWKLTFAMQSWG